MAGEGDDVVRLTEDDERIAVCAAELRSALERLPEGLAKAGAHAALENVVKFAAEARVVEAEDRVNPWKRPEG